VLAADGLLIDSNVIDSVFTADLGHLFADFKNALLVNVNFENSILKGNDFSSANLSGADFKGSILNLVKLNGSNLHSTDFLNAEFISPYLYNTDLQNAKNLGTIIWSDDYIVGEEREGDIEKSRVIYSNLINLYQEKGFPEIADKFQYRENIIVAKNSNFPFNLITKFFWSGKFIGTISPIVIVILVIPIIIIFAILYSILTSLKDIKSGIYTAVRIPNSSKKRKKLIPLESKGLKLLSDCLIFSTISLISLGYSTIYYKRRLSLYGIVTFDYRAVRFVRVFSALEAIIGICLIVFLLLSVLWPSVVFF